MHTGLPNELIAYSRLVIRFSAGYDFRNKRLPVWQIDYVNDVNLRVFVDPVTGILVDQNRDIDRLESLSFSLLHKWNFLRPMIGRFWRDQIIVLYMLACLCGSTLGFTLWWKRRRRSSVRVGELSAGYIE